MSHSDPRFFTLVQIRLGLSFLLALMLHGLWLYGPQSEGTSPSAERAPVRVHFRLQADRPAAAPANAPTAPRPATATRAFVTPRAPAAHPLPAAPATVLADAQRALDTLPMPQLDAPAAPAATTPAAEAEPGAALLRVAAPDPGSMDMRIVRNEPHGAPLYGIAHLSWQHENGLYQLHFSADLDVLLAKVNLYQVQSEGQIDATGIRPLKVEETRRGRSPTATHFDYEHATLGFSTREERTAMQSGAQDKVSVLMQLAGMGRADPTQFYAGRELAIQIAEERDASVFMFVVQGQETLNLPQGPVQTWHLIRPARPGSYNATLELWLAPDFSWYPVQMKNTEANGAVTLQTATRIEVQPRIER